MLPPSRLLALAAAASVASAAFQGFNYGSTFTDGRPKTQVDYEGEFLAATNLEGTNGGFTSARLYTMVQAGTANDPISAIPAAIKTRTSLLFGLWASAGPAAFANELEALRKTIAQYGSQLDGLVAGISIGSEDLYRASPMGVAAGEYAGASPDTLVGYINQVRDMIRGTPLGSAPLGHVDTWTAYVNGSNAGLISACDWLGMDAYPYFQSTQSNSIASGRGLFADALAATRSAAQGKPVWITETGWPVSGKTVGSGVPSLENARTFWRDVGCPMFGITNVWWFTLQDSAPGTPNPSFGLIGSTLTNKPLYDLSCANLPVPSGDAGSGSGTSSGSGSGSGTGSGAGSGSGSDTGPVSGGSTPTRGGGSSPTAATTTTPTGGAPKATMAVGAGLAAALAFAVL